MTADRIAVAFDAAIGHLADDGDRRALVLALVEHMPPEGVAELLARLIECHPEALDMARVLLDSDDHLRIAKLQPGVVVGAAGLRKGLWRTRRLDRHGAQSVEHPTREAAEAALIAAQPVPAAVVRVQS